MVHSFRMCATKFQVSSININQPMSRNKLTTNREKLGLGKKSCVNCEKFRNLPLSDENFLETGFPDPVLSHQHEAGTEDGLGTTLTRPVVRLHSIRAARKNLCRRLLCKLGQHEKIKKIIRSSWENTPTG